MQYIPPQQIHTPPAIVIYIAKLPGGVGRPKRIGPGSGTR